MRPHKGQLYFLLRKIEIAAPIVDGEANQVGAEEGWLADVVGGLHDCPREQVGFLIVQKELRGDKCRTVIL